MISLVRAGVAAALLAVAPLLLSASRECRRKGVSQQRACRQRGDAGSADQIRRRHADQAAAANPARRRRRLQQERFPRRHGAARPDRGRRRRTTAPPGCGSRAPSCKSARRTTTKSGSCSNAHRPPPISPISERTAAARRPTVLPSSAMCWRSANCGGLHSMRCGCRSSCAKRPTCAGNMKGCARRTASACSITASMPTPPRRAPAFSSPRICRRAPTFRRSWCWPAPTSRLCRPPRSSFASKDLQHGSSYNVTLRAGLPSTVHETLSKSADFSIYVRDRNPAVHFSSTAYVLPRTGQRGIPVISTNTRAVAVEIYRLTTVASWMRSAATSMAAAIFSAA